MNSFEFTFFFFPLLNMCVTSCILQAQCSAGFLQVNLQVLWSALMAVNEHIINERIQHRHTACYMCKN